MAFDDGDDSSFFQRKTRTDLTSKIMITAIISLTAVVFIVTLLHLYARCILRRQERRHAALQRLLIAAAASRAAPSGEPPKIGGLQPYVIAQELPTTVFKKTEENETAEECSVCLTVLQDGETVRDLPHCGHTFHAECIDRWFCTQSSCPICRAEALPRCCARQLSPEPREAAVRVVDLAVNNGVFGNVEGTSVGAASELEPRSAKIVSTTEESNSSFRLSSFAKILGRERSSRRIQSIQCYAGEDGEQDLERQLFPPAVERGGTLA
ncbi:unnamed protein product [Cuscuta europaea]|uniref:RING-type domain-containing protein n=1 Tax=Cuscuta europaea TaxID=41803 RepID=A0A9P1EA01_CUSEU|nr:unnamed protein product [Cuscuta europaea]